MSLVTLVNGGADCGPVNPLQGLTKNLDSDRGVQQDYFGANRAGPSRGAFRTAQPAPSGFEEDAARFFSASQSMSPAPPASQSPFDLAALRSALPAPSLSSTRTFSPPHSFLDQAPASSWATDFVMQPSVSKSLQPTTPLQHQGNSNLTQEQMYRPSFSRAPNFHSGSQIDNKQLQNAFEFVEQGQTSVEPTSELEPASQPQEADLLARTAGLLVQSVDHETNPKFVNSEFLGLMKQLRDRKAIVEEDANEAYFRQDNQDYANYWEAHHAPEWQQLQRDWERFEATTTGVRPLAEYQFQHGNPYLLGERSYNHAMHGGSSQYIHSRRCSVLEMEATVQRDPTNARAWYELGVKQQENEREQQAILALQRALDLDPTHLPSWLALAISYTNEGDRHGTYQAVRNWVRHNEAYRDIVTAYEAGDGLEFSGTDEFQKLIGCLIVMARGVSQRSTGGSEVDADVQIALAVLLNTNEDYSRAQDCFHAALSVRPGDWLLYNRVGATLANGGRAGEALAYYYRALDINPAYIRARFNLGISCINLKRYEEAAQHILDALVLQDSDGLRGSDNNRGVTSNALWDTLKTCCLHMQRTDLAAMCDNQNLQDIRNELL
ncbi:hypothetical protein BC826DRAFT_1089741 [Russula brevipes]|nr:hypothetical protein BC826DRAFT_1089741 [Russula brevipes]